MYAHLRAGACSDRCRHVRAPCADMCRHMRMDTRTNIRADVHIETSVDMRPDVSVDMCVHTCVDVSIDMCAGMREGVRVLANLWHIGHGILVIANLCGFSGPDAEVLGPTEAAHGSRAFEWTLLLWNVRFEPPYLQQGICTSFFSLSRQS